ncbi:hypothetical protein TRFO_32157 [Tritrichomonas foetus]|uniref:Ras-GEF domain-containing protein n=1 Tax=Tritrichomonas foetus TaxID=1144522 RepID=A0A1J4JPB1_9EUKA|nr:hypothetical protein TRFO_32157 [Tritrichomonas foetus]|eukprot:OHT00991.1 hypothetical protein TRFO_32157 [Tritrichomonas foetus]
MNNYDPLNQIQEVDSIDLYNLMLRQKREQEKKQKKVLSNNTPPNSPNNCHNNSNSNHHHNNSNNSGPSSNYSKSSTDSGGSSTPASPEKNFATRHRRKKHKKSSVNEEVQNISIGPIVIDPSNSHQMEATSKFPPLIVPDKTIEIKNNNPISLNDDNHFNMQSKTPSPKMKPKTNPVSPFGNKKKQDFPKKSNISHSTSQNQIDNKMESQIKNQSKDIKLYVDNTLSLDFYFDNPNPPPIPGLMICILNEKKITDVFKPKFVTPSPNVAHIVSFVEISDTYEDSSYSDSEDDSKIDKSNMPTTITHNLMDSYIPSGEEIRLSFLGSTILQRTTLNRIPTVSKLESVSSILAQNPNHYPSHHHANADEKDEENEELNNTSQLEVMMHSALSHQIEPKSPKMGPTVAYNPRVKRNRTHSSPARNERETDKQTNNKFARNNHSNSHSCHHNKANNNDLNDQPDRHSNFKTNKYSNNKDDDKTNLANEIKKSINSIVSKEDSFLATDKDFAFELDGITRGVNALGSSANLAFSAKPPDELKDFNITYLTLPNESEITTTELNGQIVIETIDMDAFLNFKFGPSVSYPNPDQLHIFTWHNLNINPLKIAKSLSHFISMIQGEGQDIDKLRCTLQYLMTWFYIFPSDFYNNEQLTSKIINVLKLILAKSKDPISKKSQISFDVNFLRACIESLSKETKKPQNFIIPLQSPTIQRNNLYNGVKLLEQNIEPSVLVNHFTYIECQILNKLQRSEFVHKNWTRSDKTTRSPNFCELITRFNATCCFIATSIIMDNARKRSQKIIYWIKVMEEARKQRNFQLLFEIDAALSCYPINRLEKSWNLINKKYVALFNKLHRITKPLHKAILKYKELILEKPKITLPYIGPFLTDLVFVSERYQPTQKLPNGKDGINMIYQNQYFSRMEPLFSEWGTKIKFTINETLLHACIELEGRVQETKDLLQQSFMLEAAREGEVS